MSKNETILLLQSVKIKLSIFFSYFSNHRVRKKNTKLDIELLHLIASLLSIGVKEEFNYWKRRI